MIKKRGATEGVAGRPTRATLGLGPPCCWLPAGHAADCRIVFFKPRARRGREFPLAAPNGYRPTSAQLSLGREGGLLVVPSVRFRVPLVKPRGLIGSSSEGWRRFQPAVKARQTPPRRLPVARGARPGALVEQATRGTCRGPFGWGPTQGVARDPKRNALALCAPHLASSQGRVLVFGRWGTTVGLAQTRRGGGVRPPSRRQGVRLVDPSGEGWRVGISPPLIRGHQLRENQRLNRGEQKVGVGEGGRVSAITQSPACGGFLLGSTPTCLCGHAL